MNTHSEGLGKSLSENKRRHLSKLLLFALCLDLVKEDTYWTAYDAISAASRTLSEWIEDINGDFYEYPRDDY